MMQPLPIGSAYTNRHGRPIGTAVFNPKYDAPVQYDAMPRENHAPPLWLRDVLHLSIPYPPSPVSSGTTSTATPYSPYTTMTSGIYTNHNVVPVIHPVDWAPYTQISSRDIPSSLDKSQISTGDGTASPQLGNARFFISRYAVLAQIQEVGNRYRATQIVGSIIALREQELTFSLGWKQTVNDLRMEVVRLFRSTFSAHRPIAPSAEDIVTGNDAWARAASKANEVAALLLELIRLGVNTPDDLAVAAGILAANHSPGYMPLLRSLLATGRYLSYSYSGVLHLKEDVLNHLPGGGGLVVNDIRRTIGSIPLPPRKRL